MASVECSEHSHASLASSPRLTDSPITSIYWLMLLLLWVNECVYLDEIEMFPYKERSMGLNATHTQDTWVCKKQNRREKHQHSIRNMVIFLFDFFPPLQRCVLFKHRSLISLRGAFLVPNEWFLDSLLNLQIFVGFCAKYTLTSICMYILDGKNHYE